MKESAGIIVKVKDKCLVCQRASENTEPGKWAIPMGGIEFDEEPKEAAYREFIEEMGAEINDDIVSVGKINRYNKLGVQKSVLHVFIFKTDTEIIPDLKNAVDGFEHTECDYMTLDEIKELTMSSGIKEVLTDVLNF